MSIYITMFVQGSTSSVTADNMADPSQQQSSFAASPSGSDDGKKKSLQSSWESDYKVSTLGIAIDMEINGKAAPSTYTRFLTLSWPDLRDIICVLHFLLSFIKYNVVCDIRVSISD